MLPQRRPLVYLYNTSFFGAQEPEQGVEDVAGRILVQCNLRIDSGNFSLESQTPRQLEFVQHRMGGGVPGTVTIPTYEVDIDLSSLYMLGWLRMRNLEAFGGSTVIWGPKSGGNLIVLGEMEPGEPACLRLRPGITLRMKAIGAPAQVHILVNNN